jgi:5'-nucleotidase / UDP-sugar diphosphatase
MKSVAGLAVILAMSSLAAPIADVAPRTVDSVATPGPARAARAGELRVTFLHTSDEHSVLLPVPVVDGRPGRADPTLGGFARLATVVEELRDRAAAAGEPVLLTSAGDYVGGTPFAWLQLDGQAPELGLMIEVGYDVATLGNPEFDYDSDRLARYLAAAGYPAAGDQTALVATNTRPPAGHALGEAGLRRTHLATLDNGLQVGFLGLLGEGASRFTTLAEPVVFDDAVTAAAQAVAALREAGAQLVVAITHAGLDEDRALARSVPGIDLILGGHDHLLLDEPAAEGGTIIVHPGSELRQLFVLQLGYDPATGSVRVRNPETGQPFVVPLDAGVAEDPRIAARVDLYRQRLEGWLAELTGGRFVSLDQPVARSAFTLSAGPPMRETNFGNLVTDAMRRAVAEATGEPVDFAFQANGMIRSDVSPGTVPEREGEISVHELAGAVGMGAGRDGLPGYPLVSIWLTGDEVRRVMEVSILLSELYRDSYFLQVSGARARFDPTRAILFRVPVRGTPIPTGRAVLALDREDGGAWVPLERRDDRLYHVVTDRYLLSFLPLVGLVVPRMAIAPKRRDGTPLHDLDEAVVRRGSQEIKVWEAVLAFAAAQAEGPDGVASLPASYAGPEGRLVIGRAAPLWAGPLAGVGLLGVGAAILVRRRRRFTAAG